MDFLQLENCAKFAVDFLSKRLIKNIPLAKFFFQSFFLFTLLFISCADNNNSYNENSVLSQDGSQKSRGRLIAVTGFNSTDYFIYRGEPMGFQYELLESFSDHSGFDIVIKPENHPDVAIDMLRSGEADILAMNLTVNKSVRRGLKYTVPVDETRQVLIQRKPEGWQRMTMEELENTLVRETADLKHKKIYVQEGSVHAGRLRSLSREIGARVDVIEVPLDDEVLIQLVDRGEIDYTVCDENISLVNASYYPGIDVGMPLSQVQKLAWGVRKADSETLLIELNEWLTEFRKTTKYAVLYAKYFRNDRSGAMIKSEYFALNTGHISRWDEIIKVYSEGIGWDWRLLASLICQESRFDPSVTSPVGAYGLMQIMPETGSGFGIDIRSSPQNNIKAGTRYIKWLHSIFDPEIEDRDERIKFILAAYNAGPGHILDAMRLAEKNGMDPFKWEGSVQQWLLKKTDPEYYTDTIVKSGFFRGNQSVAFVDEILERYEHYVNIVP